MRGVYIKELGKFTDTEFAREYFAKKKHEGTNAQILEKLDEILTTLKSIEKELKNKNNNQSSSTIK